MLKILRREGVMKKLVWIIAIIVILSFGVFGTAYLVTDTPSKNYAGTIFGRKISFNKFQKAYNNSRAQAIIRYGDKYNENRPYLDLDSETWDRLILLHKAKKQKIKISNKELVQTIQSYPFFQRNGQYDTPLYNNVVRYVFEMKPRDFEESIRNSIKIAKIVSKKTAGITIDKDAPFEFYKKQTEKTQVSYVFLPSKDFTHQAHFEEQELKEYYNNNKLQFLVPSSINLAYISLPLIEIQGEKNETENDPNAAVKIKAEKIYQDALAKNSLQESAKNNQIQSKLSGFLNREEPNKDLNWSFDILNRSFHLKPNEITDPIILDREILILQLIEKRAFYIPEYTETYDKVVEAVLLINAKEIARNKSKENLKIIKGNSVNNFTKAVKKTGLKVQKTPEFTRRQYLPKIGIASPFHEAAFQLDESNKISDVIESKTGFYILHFEKYIPMDPIAFEEKEKNIAQQLLEHKRNEALKTYISVLRKEAKLEDFIAEQREKMKK